MKGTEKCSGDGNAEVGEKTQQRRED